MKPANRLRKTLARASMIPDLDFWVRLNAIERAGPFALPLVTASSVYRSAYTVWFAGMIQGPEPTLNVIGWALKP